MIGSLAFASINCHNPKVQYTKRDDLESLMYVLSYLAVGRLPWTELARANQDSNLIKQLKEQTPASHLFLMMPEQFVTMHECIVGKKPKSQPKPADPSDSDE